MSHEISNIPLEAFGKEPASETLYISPEFLHQENQSEQAQARIGSWNVARGQGRLVAQKRCGDARPSLVKATEAVDIRTIACGGSNEPYDALLNSPGVKMAGNFTHHDGEEMEKFIADPMIEELPESVLCGGQQGAQKGVTGEVGIGCYIEQDIEHFDPTVQAVVVAAEAAKSTDKIVFAASQDHLSGLAHPIAWFANHGKISASAIPQGDIYEMMYNPESFDARRVYENGFPTLKAGEMPNVLAEFFETNQQQVAEMAEKYPDLRDRKKVQDPGVIILSTDIRPVVVRYPGLEVPGSFFELRVPRTKINGVDIQIDVDELERVLNQAEYAITHATAHAGQKGKSFASMKQLLIETRTMDKSRHLADVITQKLWMQDWLQLGDTEILLAQTVGGQLQDADKYSPTI
ncbi:MAG TPA: hypothetical protein PLD54_02465 [Candidatus Levybacteria bacterium]|nr:hypothetical protein [Candidatus Levybacteria bacterium]